MNMKKTLKDMGRSQFIRGIATAMVVAGATYGISDALGVSTEPATETVKKGTEIGSTATATVPTLFEEVRDRLVQSSIQTGVATSVQIITEDLKWKDALRQGVINTGVSSFGALGANKLSLLYNGGKGSWNYAAHKLGHFALGGAMGAASNYKDPFKGFLSGGAGAMCAEVIMEGLPSTMRMSDSSRLTRALIGTGTFLAGGNVTITDLTATNAIENNSFMPSPYPEVQEQQYKNMKATGEYLTNLLGEDAPGFADARAWFSSGCDVLNDMYFGLLPGISPENRAFMENQLPWNMAIDLVPAKVGEVGLVAAPLLRTGGQGAKAVFKALPSKGLTPNLATESGHALKVYTTRELASEAIGIKGFQVKKGDQPWVIREGQEWKSKVYGKAQKTGTTGHRFRTYCEGIKLAKNEDIEVVSLDRGINRFLDKGKKIKPNRRPDIAYRRNDGKINQIEVPSKTDVPKNLIKRMKDTNRRLPEQVKSERQDIKEIRKGRKND